MIISCTKCSKKFEINSDLIPESGRLLECSACSHQWFFKKRIEITEQDISNHNIKIDRPNKTVSVNLKKDNKIIQKNKDTNKNKIKSNPIEVENYASSLDISTADKKIGFLNIIFLFMISFVAFIVFIDTFKTPASIFFPEIEVILYNLYETFKDVVLFLKDLI
tara:strand:- start:207 stop:698 length:492 start_codon:yes stop_codon:yes gene_type:complete